MVASITKRPIRSTALGCLSTLVNLFGCRMSQPARTKASQEVSHRRLSCAGPSPAYLRSSTVQFFPLIVITQSIVTSAWAIYGMASIIVRDADAEPQAA